MALGVAVARRIMRGPPGPRVMSVAVLAAIHPGALLKVCVATMWRAPPD
jgi:hypothetical protein